MVVINMSDLMIAPRCYLMFLISW